MLAHQDGVWLLPVGGTPGSWRIPGEAVPEYLGEFLSATGGAALPGKTWVLNVTLRNPFPEAVRFELDWRLPAFLEKHNVPDFAEVPAGGTAQITAGFLVKPGTAGTERGEIELSGRRPGTGFEGKLTHSVPCALSGRFTLNCWEQYVSFMEADPTKKHLIWQGAADLSASGVLRLDGDALLLELDVADDRHSQSFRGDQIWRGDSVQAGFQFPGQSGHFELGLALADDGSIETFVWNAPGAIAPEAVRLIGEAKAEDGAVHYRLRLPLNELGVSPETARMGFRFNVMVNDNDGEEREGFLRLAPGIGSARDVARYPFILP